MAPQLAQAFLVQSRVSPEPVAHMSSPPHSSQETVGKLKKKPTVTPRRFRRFFTPRTSLPRDRGFGVSRLALGDLSAAATNRRWGKRRSPQKNTVLFATEVTPEPGCRQLIDPRTGRKRKALCSPDTTPEHSSPSKKLRSWSVETDLRTEYDYDDSKTDIIPEEEYQILRRNILKLPKPIVRSRYRRAIGIMSRRELDVADDVVRRPRYEYTNEWQSETTNFYSGSHDVHDCMNVGPPPPERALPFCTASCNTNTLIAVGDEEGGVRLLESAKDSLPGFRERYLSFRPHTNAILDLAFSSDDLLLVTASGDQTSHVVDMPTQRIISTLSGHVASVKQVCFQPCTSNNVIATSSRDGSVQIWDLRCKGVDMPQVRIKVSFEGPSEPRIGTELKKKIILRHPVNIIGDAHAARNHLGAVVPALNKYLRTADSPSKFEPVHGRRGDVSITSLAFLGDPHPHLLITGSEANASVKLWDLRNTYNVRRGHATPVSFTRQPESHSRYRQYGLTSIAVSSDSGRLYTLSRDNTVYAYSTSHLILGSAAVLERGPAMTSVKRSAASEKEGLGPLYGFRHPMMHAATFYIKLAIRQAKANQSELLAVGSSDSCAVVFPTSERHMHGRAYPEFEPADIPPMPFASFPSTPTFPTPMSTPSFAPHRLNDTTPIYRHGSALIQGHKNEVTGVAWTTAGELISVGDDFRARVWRENNVEARNLRMNGERGGARWGKGWAEVEEGWDDDEE